MTNTTTPPRVSEQADDPLRDLPDFDAKVQARAALDRQANERVVQLDDKILDSSHGPTRLFLLAEHWRREAQKARSALTLQVTPDDWQLVPKKLTPKMEDVLEFGRKQPAHNTYLNLLCAAPVAPATQHAVPEAPTLTANWRDKLRWSKANTDYHGYIAFTPGQLEHFVSMLAPVAAPEAPASEQQAAVAMECVKAVSIGYTSTNHMTQELCCAECGANLDNGDDHKADCLTLRARALLAGEATTASASGTLQWTADEIVDACVKAGLGVLEANSLIVILKGAGRAPAPSREAAPLDNDAIDTLARKHNLDGSMLVGHRHDYWRAFAADVIRAAMSAATEKEPK